MRLIPHGHTVLVEPDEQPPTTESGLLLPEDRSYVPTSGVVVAVGKGSQRLWERRRDTVRKCLMLVSDALSRCALQRYLDSLNEPEPSVKIGERVVFAVDAGLLVKDDGQPYILLNEDEIALVIEESESAA